MGWNNRNQEIALALIPKFSSILSLFGSIWIVIEVITGKSSGIGSVSKTRKLNHPYHRLLFAMSIYDILESIWNFMSTWPIPEGTPNIAWAVGNTQTCTAQGFFLMLSVAVPIYNALLSFYYVLVIKYKVSDDTLRKRVEPTFHIIAGGWGFFTALYSATTGLMNNANLWCWIAPLPSDCKDTSRYGSEEGNCTRGDNAWIYRWAFYFAPLWTCIFVASIFTYVVYRYVKNLDQSSLRYRKPERTYSSTYPSSATTGGGQQRLQQQGDVDIEKSPPKMSPNKKAMRTTTTRTRFEDDDNDDQALPSSSSPIPTIRHVTFAHLPPATAGSSEDDGGVEEQQAGYDDDEVKIAESTDKTEENEQDQEEDYDYDDDDEEDGCEDTTFNTETMDSSSSSRSRSRRSSSMVNIRDAVSQWKSTREISNREYTNNYKRTLEVYHQALWYVGTFYITHVWSTTNRIIQFIFNGYSFFPLTALHAWFDPLQGFLNFLVYQRPHYIKLRKKYPNIGRFGAFRRILRFSYLPEPESWKDNNTNNQQQQHQRRHQSPSPNNGEEARTRIGPSRLSFISWPSRNASVEFLTSTANNRSTNNNNSNNSSSNNNNTSCNSVIDSAATTNNIFSSGAFTNTNSDVDLDASGDGDGGGVAAAEAEATNNNNKVQFS